MSLLRPILLPAAWTILVDRRLPVGSAQIQAACLQRTVWMERRLVHRPTMQARPVAAPSITAITSRTSRTSWTRSVVLCRASLTPQSFAQRAVALEDHDGSGAAHHHHHRHSHRSSQHSTASTRNGSGQDSQPASKYYLDWLVADGHRGFEHAQSWRVGEVRKSIAARPQAPGGAPQAVGDGAYPADDAVGAGEPYGPANTSQLERGFGGRPPR